MATIQGVYVALFGRPADPTGLAFFNTATNNGANLNAIGDLAATKEYTDRFTGFNNIQIVTTIYQSLFNRVPEAAGLNFFVDALNKGTLNIKNIAIAILDGAQGSDKTILDLKLAAAAEFTKQLDTPTEVAAYIGNDAAASARNWLAGITTTAPTTTAVGDAIKALTVGNSSIALTAGADEVTLTSTTSTLKSTNNDDTITAAAGNINNGDSISGGLGTDTLNATHTAATTITPTKLDSVEKIFWTQTTNAGGLALTNATGVTEAWVKASTAAATISDLVKTITIGVEGAATDATFTFKAAEVSGTADVATLALKGANATGAVTIDGVETLNIVTSGTASTVASLAASTLKDVKISGDVGGSILFASTTLKTVDASAVNGSGVSVDVKAATAGVTVTGSKFGETITLNNTGGLATDKDVVIYTTANISTATTKDTITNFTTGEDKLDLKAFALTGAKTAITAFGAVPGEGASFLGNAVASNGNDIYVDTNNDGKFNAATDMVLTVGAGNVAATDIIFA